MATAGEPWLEGLTDDWIASSRLSIASHTPLPQFGESQQGPSESNSPCTSAPLQPIYSYAPIFSELSLNISQHAKPHGDASAPKSPLDTATMNVKPCQGNERGNTPEWKRRLLRGDLVASGDGDLFGPTELQKLFTPPNTCEAREQAVLPKRDERICSFSKPKLSGISQRSKLLRSWDKENINLTWMERMSEVSPADITRLLQSSQLSINECDVARLKRDFSNLSLSSAGLSIEYLPGWSASSLEETTGEAASPIPLSTGISSNHQHLHICRPTSSASDTIFNSHLEPADGRPDTDDSLEITSQSLPEGLTMGTHEFATAGGFGNMHRGGCLASNSFQKRWLSPSLAGSNLPSSIAASRYQKSTRKGESRGKRGLTKLPSPFTPKKQTGVSREHSQTPSTSAMKSSGSPLKLFGDYDTFTSNKLLRRMSQFEETFEATIEEGPSCAIESDGPSEYQADSHIHEGVAPRPSTNPFPSPNSRKQSAPHSFSKLADKRGLNSPTKSSSAKRRRTLVPSDHSSKGWHQPIIESSVFSSAQSSPQQLEIISVPSHTGSGSRTTSSHPGRPKNPTPTQLRLSDMKSNRHESNDEPALNRDSLPFSRSIQQNLSVNAIRKGSITTQDFLNEATKIMNHIRSHGGRKSELPGLEESIAASDRHALSEISTQEEFSRPPSREGGCLRRQNPPKDPDPQIMSHLKKFEDTDELDVFMGTSVMSLHLKSRQSGGKWQGNGGTETRADLTSGQLQEGLNSLPRRQMNQFSTNDLGLSNEDFKTVTSTGSIPTGSTGSAKAKGIISSQMVSHLIPEKVGVMTYDRIRHMWIKGRLNHNKNFASFISEDDPFGDIPDLSINELREYMAAENSPCDLVKPGVYSDTTNMNKNSCQNQTDKISGMTGLPPQTQGSIYNPPLDTSSVQSKSTSCTSNEPRPGTRATSWATSDLGIPSILAVRPEYADSQQRRVPDVKCSTPPGNKSPISLRTISNDRKNVSVGTTSRDTAQTHNTIPLEVTTDQPNSNDIVDLPRKMNREDPIQYQHSLSQIIFPQTFRLSGTLARNGAYCTTEHNESNLLREQVEQELSVLPVQDEFSLLASNSYHDASYSFHMSPLAEFTVNQIDESMRLEVSYVAERTHPHSLRQVHGTFTLAVEELIKHITDVEPYEVYWEHLRRLHLQGKKLITLLRLNKYCSRLEELDASNNNIGQLSGVPTSMRSLNISHNFLSNLTAWSHLSNLQYLDVSHNHLENLDGLSGLIHLRSLNVNNNRLRCIKGILGLDGLLTLKARNNLLTSLDFKGSDLVRLSNLDLSGNHISSIANIDTLSALEKLSLGRNEIREMFIPGTLQHLRWLKLSYNHLLNLDVSPFPALQLLYLDCNHLTTIDKLETCPHLETLSIREQTGFFESNNMVEPLAVDFDLSSNLSIRKVYLSCNRVSSEMLSPACPISTLQFLDLASCGLDELPEGFGKSYPNLRSLNLNFNALSNIDSLSGISRLSHLSLVGNRISRLRKCCQTLKTVGGLKGCLTKVDLRGNPLTVGFYPSPVSGNGRSAGVKTDNLFTPKSHQLTRHVVVEDDTADDNDALAPLGGCVDVARVEHGDHASLTRPGFEDVEVEIDDPYTVPAANSAADKKYLAHLDEATKLRRRVVELMVHAATCSRLKVLDGLHVEERDAGHLKKDWVWERLVELGVLKKKAH
ncbi:Protein nud1 [Ophidiomyces ophidiicola]|nr:Protein nud1 [Ophidiomyces ophidiicola]